MSNRLVSGTAALGLLLTTVVPSWSKERPAAPDSFTLLQQTAEGWKVGYVSSVPPPDRLEISGVPHLLFTGGAAGMEGEAGKPQLPVEALSLGIPDGAELRVEIVDPVYGESRDQLVAPNPSYTYTDDKEAVPHYTKNSAFYAQNRFFPAQIVAVQPPYVVRRQRISTVRIAPYQYNPVTKVLRQLVRATLNIRMVPVPGRLLDLAPTSAPPDPRFEHVYHGLLWNYEQAKQWRQPPPAQGSYRTADSTRDWFETGRTYYRIPVASDGWYKLTKADVAAAGGNPDLIDVNTLKVFGKGREVPVFIRPDTTVEFYALMNYGDSTYIDFYTDTSTYWLTWGGSIQGQRFTPVSQPAGPDGLNIVSAKVTRHFEHNDYYYPGATEAEVADNEVVPGEGWTWGQQPDWFYVNTSKTFPVALDAVERGTSPSGIRARLFGANLSSPPVSHRARFWINDSLVGDITFPQRTEGFLSGVFPSTLLLNDTSTLRITSLPTSGSLGLFYLDWFEVDYWRILRATGNQLFFTSPPSSGTDPALFTATGFSNPQIDVFDLTGHREILGGTVSGDSSSGFSIAFRDTFSTARSYLIECPGGARPVLRLGQKVFADIRVNPTGADYIIIAHRLFMPAAQQLGAHRQSVNNVRVKVLDVQDIYDEFNYGVFNATAIKAFLQYAYLHWPAPAITYLLFLGDASWDYHHYAASTTQTNYIPAYGVPAGDNWFGCFNPDTALIPSLLIGRMPVRDTVQARQAVAKLIGYDSYTLGDWSKSYMFITGGNDTNERRAFNYLSNSTIDTYIAPPPLGGTAFKIYKSSQAVIDGEWRQPMRDLVRNGLVYVNFLGHSGGRYWGVDIGDPNTLENTNGMLPFLSSVSCNVGAFAEPSNTLLAEEFVLADNRGSIASWASSSLGFASLGAFMNQYFLNGVANQVRDLGSLTTTARIRLWQTFGNDWTYVAMVKLNPLLGDPLTQLAIPLLPDLEVANQDILLNTNVPTPNDSLFTVHVNFRNFGLVPSDSVGITVTDDFNGQSTPIITNKKTGRTLHNDSLFVRWDAAYANQVGRHTLTVQLDPTHSIPEVNEFNNTASVNQYIYANYLSVVKPLNNMVVPAGPQTLVVTSPIGVDSIGFQYFFELDTVTTFDSPFRIQSPPVVPGPVSGEWTTPPLPNNTVYFWRVRTIDAGQLGSWVTSSFSTSSSLPPASLSRWRESTRRQFAREKLYQLAATDSGVTISPNTPLNLYCRSVGARASTTTEYYSIMRLNDLLVTGYWWVVGYGFVILRVNEFSGDYDLRYFSPVTIPSDADSMAWYIRTTPVGNYLAMISIYYPHAGVNESLYVALESLGSTRIRGAADGQSWAMISRKGYPSATLESLTNDSAVVSIQVPNYYSFGSGSMTTTGISIPTQWDSFHWRYGGTQSGTDVRIALLGVRDNARVDTLRLLTRDSTDISLGFLNRLTSGPTYASLKTAALLSTDNALVTPAFQDWWVDFEPPSDLAISARTVGVQNLSLQKGALLSLPVTVYNIGFRGVDSARIVVSVFDKLNRARPVASAMLDTIPVNGTKSTTIPISTTNFSRRVTLQVNVSPSKKYKDLVPDNNNAYYSFDVIGAGPGGIRFFADGVQLMDGDFVAAKPSVIIQLPPEGEGQGVRRVEFLVDNKPVRPAAGVLAGDLRAQVQSNEELTFNPELSSGRHELKARAIEVTSNGDLDTLEQAVNIDVQQNLGILKLYNYPNPFSRDTYITFVLSGSQQPEELRIRIFTISGRRIKEIVVPQSRLAVGFNKVYWDGRDADGDEIANGYYFYQVTVKGQGKTESSIEKLAKVR